MNRLLMGIFKFCNHLLELIWIKRQPCFPKLHGPKIYRLHVRMKIFKRLKSRVTGNPQMITHPNMQT